MESRGNFRCAGGGPLGSDVGAQTTALAPDPQVQQGRRELRRDQRDLGRDRRDLRTDNRDRIQDRHEVHQHKVKLTKGKKTVAR